VLAPKFIDSSLMGPEHSGLDERMNSMQNFDSQKEEMRPSSGVRSIHNRTREHSGDKSATAQVKSQSQLGVF
jgi:hypothetical protein